MESDRIAVVFSCEGCEAVYSHSVPFHSSHDAIIALGVSLQFRQSFESSPAAPAPIVFWECYLT